MIDEWIDAVRELAATNRREELPLGLTTRQAAAILGRKPKTLRKWSSEGSGPLAPRKCHGRLIWPLASIEKLLKGQHQTGSAEHSNWRPGQCSGAAVDELGIEDPAAHMKVRATCLESALAAEGERDR